jgi:hypothetical protein
MKSLIHHVMSTERHDGTVTTMITLQARHPMNHTSILERGKRFLSSPVHPGQLWGPSSPQLLNGYQRIFLVQKLRLSEDIPNPPPIHAFVTCTGHPDLSIMRSWDRYK